MTYEAVRDWLFSQLPMFQKVGKSAYRADLTNVLKLADYLGHPEQKFKSIHIAGTNGKGSVSHMLAAIFQQAGYKTGLYTSPHLLDFRERIKVNGQPIPEAEVVSFTVGHQTAFVEMGLSFFEMTVGMAYHYFAKEAVDIAIVETGMGGRLDATNIIQPEMCVITNIGMDHAVFLGDTLPKIAKEKAGIIKSGVPVVIGAADNSEIKAVFEQRAFEMLAPIFFAETYKSDIPECDLKGPYQKHNIRTVMKAMEVWQGLPISQEAVLAGLASAAKLTGLRGRWETIRENPKVICDTGHNTHAFRLTLPQLQIEKQNGKLHMVFGLVADKDVASILELLPNDAYYFFCKPDIPRGLPSEDLEREARFYGLVGQAYKSVEEAYQKALLSASKDDLIFVGGSTFVVADFLMLLKKIEGSFT
jgi:dihydrofolate synthase / folylpolyglutamate synthase